MGIVATILLATAAVIVAVRRTRLMNFYPRKGMSMTEQKSDRPLLGLIGRMTTDSVETSTLDARSLMLVRIAALVAVHAPPASYLVNLAAASEVGIDAETARAVLVGIAPVVGTPAVTAAAGNIARALGFAIEMLDMEETAS